MRKFLLFLLVLPFDLFSQADPNINEQVRSMSKGSQPALVMEIPFDGKSYSFIYDEWEKFVRPYKGRTKYDKKTDESFCDDMSLKEMSENHVDVYFKVQYKAEKTAELVFWFNLGVTYLSTKEYAKGMPAGIQLIRDFYQVLYVNSLEEQMKVAEKEMKDQEKILKDLKKDEDGFDKTIQQYENDIKKLQDKISAEKDKKMKNLELQAEQKGILDLKEKSYQELKSKFSQGRKKKSKK